MKQTLPDFATKWSAVTDIMSFPAVQVALFLAVSAFISIEAWQVGLFDPFTYSTASLAERAIQDGHLSISPFDSLPYDIGAHANSLSLRVGNTLSLATLSLVTGISLYDIVGLPVHIVLHGIMVWAIVRRLTGLTWIPLLASLVSMLDPGHKATISGMFYGAYGETLFLFILLLALILGPSSTSQVRTTRTTMFLMVLGVVSVFFYYYTAHLLSVMLIALIAIMLKMQVFRDPVAARTSRTHSTMWTLLALLTVVELLTFESFIYPVLETSSLQGILLFLIAYGKHILVTLFNVGITDELSREVYQGVGATWVRSVTDAGWLALAGASMLVLWRRSSQGRANGHVAISWLSVVLISLMVVAAMPVVIYAARGTVVWHWLRLVLPIVALASFGSVTINASTTRRAAVLLVSILALLSSSFLLVNNWQTTPVNYQGVRNSDRNVSVVNWVSTRRPPEIGVADLRSALQLWHQAVANESYNLKIRMFYDDPREGVFQSARGYPQPTWALLSANLMLESFSGSSWRSWPPVADVTSLPYIEEDHLVYTDGKSIVVLEAGLE